MLQSFSISSLSPNNEQSVHEAAEILTAAFVVNWPHAWATPEEALDEVSEALAPDRICRAAFDDAGAVLGWIGGNAQYGGNVWELHPLAVRPDVQGRGIGRALVADFERQVAERGGLTIVLGTDDEAEMTSLSGVDLYPNVWEHIATIRNRRGHPYTFYQKCGFVITGVVPDANGPGKPDILMAKRVPGAGQPGES